MTESYSSETSAILNLFPIDKMQSFAAIMSGLTMALMSLDRHGQGIVLFCNTCIVANTVY